MVPQPCENQAYQCNSLRMFKLLCGCSRSTAWPLDATTARGWLGDTDIGTFSSQQSKQMLSIMPTCSNRVDMASKADSPLPRQIVPFSVDPYIDALHRPSTLQCLLCENERLQVFVKKLIDGMEDNVCSIAGDSALTSSTLCEDLICTTLSD